MRRLFILFGVVLPLLLLFNYNAPNTYSANTPMQLVTGFKLPWPNGITWRVTNLAHSPTGNNPRQSIDLGLPENTPVRAMKAGDVVLSRNIGGATNGYVVIDHNDGYCSAYVHLKTLEFAHTPSMRIPIQQGATIGTSGRLGTNGDIHLHVAVYSRSGSSCGGYSDIDKNNEQVIIFDEVDKPLQEGDYLTSENNDLGQGEKWIFDDVQPGDSAFWAVAEIEAIYNNQITTTGCNSNPPPLLFCPDDPLLRGQIAVYLIRMKYGASYTPPPATGTVFEDVPATHPFAAYIEKAYADGITGGCAPSHYCPSDATTRGQAAVMMARTLNWNLDFPLDHIFEDESANDDFAHAAEYMWWQGFTNGCPSNNPGLYFCTNDGLTRAHGAVFIARVMGYVPVTPKCGDLTITVSPAGAGSATQAQGDCPIDPSKYKHDSPVSTDATSTLIQPNPEGAYTFSHWEGYLGGASSHQETQVGDRQRSATAHFTNCVGDFDDSNEITIVDVQRSAYRWNTQLNEDALYHGMYDLDKEGDIDIVDVQRVSYNWNTPCPSHLLARHQTPYRPSAPVDVMIVPGSQTVQVGTPFTISVAVAGVEDLGGFEFTWTYNPALLSFVSAVVEEDFPESTGRDFQPLPAQTEGGTLTFGAYSLGATPSGASGGGLLATLTFQPLATGMDQIDFLEAQLVTVAGIEQTIGQMTGGQVVLMEEGTIPTATPSPTNTPNAMHLYLPMIQTLQDAPPATVPPAPSVTPIYTSTQMPIPTSSSTPTATSTLLPSSTATSTPTQVTPPTATPTATRTVSPTPELYTFYDDFSDSGSGWPTIVESSYRAEYISNQYQFTIYGNVLEAWHTNAQHATLPPTLVNYSVEAEMRLYDGEPVRYGLVFDLVDSQNFYIFTINPDTQSWQLARVRNGARTTLDEGTDSAIDTGTATNEVRVQIQNGQIAMYVNDELVDTQNDSDFTGTRRVGLASKAGTNTVRARFDNFRLQQLP